MYGTGNSFAVTGRDVNSRDSMFVDPWHSRVRDVCRNNRATMVHGLGLDNGKSLTLVDGGKAEYLAGIEVGSQLIIGYVPNQIDLLLQAIVNDEIFQLVALMPCPSDKYDIVVVQVFCGFNQVLIAFVKHQPP